jgi:hypothetical protein
VLFDLELSEWDENQDEIPAGQAEDPNKLGRV